MGEIRTWGDNLNQQAQFANTVHQQGGMYNTGSPNALAQAQLAAQAAMQWQNPRNHFPPTTENTMDRNPTDRATALECLKWAINSPTKGQDLKAVIARAESYYAFVTGQPEETMTDRAVKAVSAALKGK